MTAEKAVRHEILQYLKKREKYDEKYSLGDLCYVLVPQADPQIIIFMQQDLLLPRVSDATGLVPEEEKSNKNPNFVRKTSFLLQLLIITVKSK